MYVINSAKTESQIANVVPNKYSNRDFECDDSADYSQRIDIQLLNSIRKWTDAAEGTG